MKAKKYNEGGKVTKKPVGKGVKKKDYRSGATYDGRSGYYPVGSTTSGRAIRKKYSAEEAPSQAARLNLDPRITEGIHEVSGEMGVPALRTEQKITKYLNRSRENIAQQMAEAQGSSSKSRLSEGESTFIPKVDNVIDKLSTLSNEDVNILKKEVIRLSQDYKDIDPESSNVDKMIFAAGVAKDQDWSSLKPLRERAGLTKGELLQLIQAPEDAGWGERLGFKAVRAAASVKEFKKGGKIQLIKRKDGSSSPRGLWDNIRAKKGSGKKPTKEILKAAKKIRNESKS